MKIFRKPNLKWTVIIVVLAVCSGIAGLVISSLNLKPPAGGITGQPGNSEPTPVISNDSSLPGQTDQYQESAQKAARVIYKEEMGNFQDVDNVYPIYTANIVTYEKEVSAYIYIADGTELKEKLVILSNALSEACFGGLPVEVTKIEENGSQKIAVVNLMESRENQGIQDYEKLKSPSWATGYFQGSCGGTVTSTQLIETMLQREYKGQWIDGIMFLYNYDAIYDFEHVPDLEKINYRK